MKKRLVLSIILPAVYVVLTSSGGNTAPPWQKENVSLPMMNQEIRHTMEENDRQKTMKTIEGQICNKHPFVAVFGGRNNCHKQGK